VHGLTQREHLAPPGVRALLEAAKGLLGVIIFTAGLWRRAPILLRRLTPASPVPAAAVGAELWLAVLRE
jgi:hypothetical protein